MTPPILTKEYGYTMEVQFRYLEILYFTRKGEARSLNGQDKQTVRTISVENLSLANWGTW